MHTNWARLSAAFTAVVIAGTQLPVAAVEVLPGCSTQVTQNGAPARVSRVGQESNAAACGTGQVRRWRHNQTGKIYLDAAERVYDRVIPAPPAGCQWNSMFFVGYSSSTANVERRHFPNCATDDPNACTGGNSIIGEPEPPLTLACTNRYFAKVPDPKREELGKCDACVGNPVNPATGNKFQREVDYRSGSAQQLVFERWYNSYDTDLSVLGPGWRHNFDRRLKLDLNGPPPYVEGGSTNSALVSDPQVACQEGWADVRAQAGSLANTTASYEGGQCKLYDGTTLRGTLPLGDLGTTGGQTPIPVRVTAIRADGRSHVFTPAIGTILYSPNSDVKMKLTANGDLYHLTYALTDSNDTVEQYDTSGKLLSITDRTGYLQTLSYSGGRLQSVTDSYGRSITFGYDDASGRLATVTPPAGPPFTYTYEGANLRKVTGPDGKYRTYYYDDPRFPLALTKINDENLDDYALWSYDEEGRVKTSQHAGGADFVELEYSGNSTTVTDALGAERTYTFTTINGVRKVVSITQPFDPVCGGESKTTTTYDSNGFVDLVTDFNCHVTDYDYDERGLEVKRTEAVGVPNHERVIETTPHSTWRLPELVEEEGRTTEYTFDGSGNIWTRKVIDTASQQERTTTWTYDAFGKVLTVDGPRTDVSDITTYQYYNCTTGNECGQIHTITKPLNQVTAFSNYDGHGNPQTVVDPNGVPTTLTYDARQRLIGRAIAGASTDFDYDFAGLLDRVTLPDDSFLDYDYDDAHRLIEIRDNLGNLIKYTYTFNHPGRTVLEEAFDSGGGQPKRVRRWVYNALGRLEEIRNANNDLVTKFEYDAQGNRTKQRDYVSAGVYADTNYVPDALNRIERVSTADGDTDYGFNHLDQRETVTDPRGLITGYVYNAFGDLKQLNSPDTGTTDFSTYDLAGNLKQKTDGRGVTVNYQYDALNRLTLVNYPGTAEDVTYSYDGTNYSTNPPVGTPYGVGRLTGISDQSGVRSLQYDARGRMNADRLVNAGTTYTTIYIYDEADRVSSITYPSGRVVAYERDPIGNIDSVTSSFVSIVTTVADNVEYMPFGGIKSYTLGNGIAVAREHDGDGRVDHITGQGVQDLRLYYTLRDEVESTLNLIDPDRSESFDYDALSRLTYASVPSFSSAYTYDGVGNRATEEWISVFGTQQITNSYETTSNRLTSAPLRSNYTYDATGNVTSRSSPNQILTYNSSNRAATIGPVSNTYNAAGQRVLKSANGNNTIFHYDQQGRLITEMMTPGPVLERDYVWLEDLPLALETKVEPLIDNGGAGFSTTGYWSPSVSAPGYYGASYLTRTMAAYTADDAGTGTSKTGTWTTYSSGSANGGTYQRGCGTPSPTFTWTLPVAEPGSYRVSVRWVSFSGVTSNASYTVTHSTGSTAYTRNQTSGSGAWSFLGIHTFGTSAQITLTRPSGTCISADAVKLEQASVTESATWAAPGPYMYQVYARWPASAGHSSAATYQVIHASGVNNAVRNQQTGGGTWNHLGTFFFSTDPGQGVRLMANSTGTVAADAVRYVPIGWGGYPRATYYYHSDHLGTPQKVTDATQQVVWDAHYQAFGGASLVVENVTQPLRFPGQYFDAETGLHQNWNRDYDPSIGRYLQSDPIGLAGGLSTYGYVGQSPINYSDPTGLYAPFRHREITRTAIAGTASCSTFNGLEEAVADVDTEPSFFESQSTQNAHWHGMSRQNDDRGQAEQRYDAYIEDQISRCDQEGLAKALHAAQDSTARGHRFSGYGGLLDISLLHILQDNFPNPWDEMHAVNYSQSLLNKFRDKCSCSCK